MSMNYINLKNGAFKIKNFEFINETEQGFEYKLDGIHEDADSTCTDTYLYVTVPEKCNRIEEVINELIEYRFT